LTKRAISKAGANRRRFFVGHLNLLWYFENEKSVSPIRVLELEEGTTFRFSDEKLEFCIQLPNGFPELVLQVDDIAQFCVWNNFLGVALLWATHRNHYSSYCKTLRLNQQHEELWTNAEKYWTTHMITQTKYLLSDSAHGMPHQRRARFWAAFTGAHNWYVRRIGNPLTRHAHKQSRHQTQGNNPFKINIGQAFSGTAHASPPKGDYLY